MSALLVREGRLLAFLLHLVVNIAEEEFQIVELKLLLALVALPLLLGQDLLEVAVAALSQAVDAAEAALAQRAVDLALVESGFGCADGELLQILGRQIAVDLLRINSLQLQLTLVSCRASQGAIIQTSALWRLLCIVR